MGKRLLAICLLFLHLALPASALESESAGSIRLTLPGGNLQLYRIAAISESGNLQLTEDFSTWEGSLEDWQSPESAKSLAFFAEKNHCNGKEKTAENGSILFSDLPSGVYLLVQTESALGYEPITPFLVVLPLPEESGQLKEIDATPKIQLTATPTQPLPSLPQTGQQKLAVLILGISGMILLLAGLVLQRRSHG